VLNRTYQKFQEILLDKLDPLERKTIANMRADKKLFYLSELIPYFKGTKIFMFANGGSVANLKNVERLNNYNLSTVHTGPLHIFRKYGFMPSMWYFHWRLTAPIILGAEKETPLDFSRTFVLVPANDSQSNTYFSDPLFKIFRKKHPEATYVLYRENRNFVGPEKISKNYLLEGVEPLHTLGGGNVENSFLPICGFLGVSTLYFCGVDHLPTGHFWDRNLPYQTVRGELSEFPDEAEILKCSAYALSVCEKRNIQCFRLEAEETVLKVYPHIDFDEAIAQASPRVAPESVGV